VVAALAGAAGVWAGLASARWLRGQFVSQGFVPGSFALRVSWLPPVAVVGGVLMAALAAAWIAGLRASRIRPVEALREATIERRGRLADVVRASLGLAALAGGIALAGLATHLTASAAAGTAIGLVADLVIAVALLAPWLTRMTVAVCAVGLRRLAVPGQLAVADSRGSDHAAVLAALTRAIHGLDPAAEVATPGDYQAAVNAQVAQNTWTIHVIVMVLLVYVVIAALNTLAMAALARRAELAILRLAGATRRQLLRMVRIEQAVLLGLALILGGAIAALTLVPMVKSATGSATLHIPAGGWLAVVGGTILLGMAGTLLPILRLLRIPPIEAIGLHE
jgi:putative ABC transport system permease protein